MPIVQVSLMEGRPSEKIEKMVIAVSEAVSTSLEAPIETVRVIVYEMQPHQYGVGGKPWRVVQEDRSRG
jgi:4-oxalocrotonate tautomerase